MSVREYVGARYVPKFADPIDWQSDTSYEALTIVTYNKSSYTSKIPVPATVGNPAQNGEYWVLTGNYNAQTQEAIETANTAKEAAEAARDSMSGEIEARKALIDKDGDYTYVKGTMKYGSVNKLNDYFGKVGAVDNDGNSFNFLTAGTDIDKVGSTTAFVNVKDFGAVGDAHYYDKETNLYYSDPAYTTRPTNDVDAIDKAINFAVKNNIHIIYFPAGDYYVPNKKYITSEATYVFMGSTGSSLVSEGLTDGYFISVHATSDANNYAESPVIFGGLLLKGNYYKNALYDTTVSALYFGDAWVQHRMIKDVGVTLFNCGLYVNAATESHFDHINIMMCDVGMNFVATTGYNPVPLWVTNSTIELCALGVQAPNGGYSCLFFSNCGLSGGRMVYYGKTPIYLANCRSEMALNECCDDNGTPIYPWSVYQVSGVDADSGIIMENCDILFTKSGANDARKIFSNKPVYTTTYNKYSVFDVYDAYYDQVTAITINNCRVAVGDCPIPKIGTCSGTSRIRGYGNAIYCKDNKTVALGDSIFSTTSLSLLSSNITESGDNYVVSAATTIDLNIPSNANVLAIHVEPTSDVTFTLVEKYDDKQLYLGYATFKTNDEVFNQQYALKLNSATNKVSITIPPSTFRKSRNNFWIEIMY